MDIIELLKARKAKLFQASDDVRKKLFEVIDADSFVELGAYAFAKNEFFDEDVDGLGVVTGYATLNDYPVYVVAQNGKILNGGLSKANCKKITEETERPLGYFFIRSFPLRICKVLLNLYKN